MDQEVKKFWVEALRSGEYKQGQHRLKQAGKFCCLGVICEIHGFLLHGVTIGPDTSLRASLPDSYLKAWGMDYPQQSRLIALNDYHKNSFAEIADYIEKEM